MATDLKEHLQHPSPKLLLIILIVDMSFSILQAEHLTMIVVGFWGYPQPGGGTHPPIPRGGVLGEVLSYSADLAWGQERKNTRI